LRVLDLVDRAKHRLLTSATQTNVECAKTELRRVEDYRHDVLREIAEHCEGHGCGTQKLEKICGLELVSREVVTHEVVFREEEEVVSREEVASREMVA
jgi:hypothetical protein